MVHIKKVYLQKKIFKVKVIQASKGKKKIRNSVQLTSSLYLVLYTSKVKISLKGNSCKVSYIFNVKIL